MGRGPAVVLAVATLLATFLAACGDDTGVAPSSSPEAEPEQASAPSEPPEPPTPEPTQPANPTDASTVAPAPSSSVAIYGTEPVSPAEPPDVSRFQSEIVTFEPFALSEDALELFEGMLLSVPVDVVFDGGGRGWFPGAVRVVDGEAWVVAGRWCDWDYEPAIDALDGAVLFEGGTLCTPGMSTARVSLWRPLASARVDDRRLVLVADGHGLRQLDVDALELEPVLQVDWDVQQPVSASFGAGQWVVVMAEAGVTRKDARGRIVFVDPSGSTVVHGNSPYPDFGTEVGPRAAALDAAGTTLIVAVEGDDLATDLVYWDLETGTEVDRHRIMGPPERADDAMPVARRFVSSLDLSDGRVLVSLTAVALEYLPAGALLVDREGNVVDLSAQGEITVVGADFLGD